jgi:hypothetical protein
MGLYTNLTNPPNPSAADLLLWPNTVGGRIMAACVGNNAATLVEMAAIVAEFQNIGWTWNPNIGCRSGAVARGLLDLGIAAAGREGECGFLAHALNELLAAPPPYGFGVVGATTATYDGTANDTGMGFIANHAGIWHNLPANMSQPAGAALSALYKWGDHVVVNYLGRYWDPSYNTSYANLQGMAVYVVTAMPSTATGHGAAFFIDASIQCQPVAGGANVWFRNKQPWEATLPHLPTGGWIGPTPARTYAPPRPVVAPPQNGCCVIL